MKRYFLSYNVLTKDYYLDYGCFDSQREFLGKINPEGLIKKLKEILPMHRLITIYSERDLDNSIKELLLNNFKNTRVNLQFKKDLESLC